MKSSGELDLSIGEVAERFGLETHVLRHWEDTGLLTPARDGAGRRRYGRDDVVRIAVIIRSKAAGMSLEQVAVLLDAESRDRHLVLQGHIDDLDRRMEEMRRSREMTVHAMECRAHDIATCPHFRSRVEDLVDGSTTAFLPGQHAEHLKATHASLGRASGRASGRARKVPSGQ
jgi:MerR family transcriptional regulator, copper efflux regulator